MTEAINAEAEAGTAKTPGKERRQFHRTGLQAADEALGLWIVRIPCGVFAFVLLAVTVRIWLTATQIDGLLIIATLSLPIMAFECGNVAIRGRSHFLRYILSGTPLESAGSDDLG